MSSEKYLPPIRTSHPLLNREYLDNRFSNKTIDRYFSTLTVNSDSVFYEVFIEDGAILAANNSCLNDSFDIVASIMDKVCCLVEIEDRLSVLVAPINQGCINEVYKSWVEQDLTDEQQEALLDLFSPIVCECLGELLKDEGLSCMDDLKTIFSLRDKVVNFFMS